MDLTSIHIMGMGIDELVIVILGLIIVIGIVTSLLKGLFGIAKIAAIIFVLYLVFNFFVK